MWKNIFCLFSSSYQFPCNDMSDPINFEFEKKRFKYGAPRVISQCLRDQIERRQVWSKKVKCVRAALSCSLLTLRCGQGRSKRILLNITYLGGYWHTTTLIAHSTYA